MIKTDLLLPLNYDTNLLKEKIIEKLPVTSDEIRELRIVKRELLLSTPGKPLYKTFVAFSVDEEKERGLLRLKKKAAHYDYRTFISPRFCGSFRPIVVGAGPAGLFAALALAESGARPLVLERGLDVEQRRKKIQSFENFGILDTECNVQFGEGGAGAYSDGKLKSGAKDEYKNRVLEEFILAGATEDIAYSTTAHLGTDKLPSIVKNIREKIISLGGEFIFGARVTELKLDNNGVCAVLYIKDAQICKAPTRAVILAIGHSARDTLSYLYDLGLPMTAKGFGIGMRIEHPREYINRLVYGDCAGCIEESASYHLVTHLPTGRSVYSFCMCPGGAVVAATSNEGGVVTNGMSEFSRNGDNSNAALLVSLTPEDFGGDSPLDGIALQEKIEKAAFLLGTGYAAPSIRLSDFLEGISPRGELVTPSYPRGTFASNPNEYMPAYVGDCIKAAIPDFDAWLPGYAMGDAALTGPETRTTSPVRILRRESGEVLGFHGVYVAGEGAGYAGGIVSSATDGLRTAEGLILNSCK